MLLAATIRKLFWPTIDWTVAIVDALRVVAFMTAEAAVAGSQNRNTRR
jgi:hypothetical protein